MILYDAIQIGETFLLIKNISISNKIIELTIVAFSIGYGSKEGKLLFTSDDSLLTFGKSQNNNVIL